MNSINRQPLILKLDKAGNPLRWIDHEEAIRLYSIDRVIASLGNEDFVFYGGINARSQERSSISIGSILLTKSAVSRAHNGSDYIPPLNNRELFRRDKHTCMYCLAELSEKHLTRDHVLPISRGGRDEWTNVVTACQACNQRKDNRLLMEIDMKLYAVPYTPNYAEWLILRNRRILADQMDFLVARCPKARRNFL